MVSRISLILKIFLLVLCPELFEFSSSFMADTNFGFETHDQDFIAGQDTDNDHSGANYNLPIRSELSRLNTLPPSDCPINITVHLALESIRAISGDAHFDFYMEMQWFDSREQGVDLFLSGSRTSLFAWIPDIYFILARKMLLADGTQYLSVKNGSMLFDRKVTVTSPCMTDPFRYPFDSVKCTIFLSSYGYDDSKVNLEWSRDAISVPKTYQGLDYIGFRWHDVEPIKILDKDVTKYGNLEYTILRCDLQFQRLYQPYVYQLFVPSGFLVLISWTSFWININATPGRAGVGITTILTLLTLTTSRRQDSTDYLYLALHTSLLDIYLWVSFLYVTAAFIEFSVTDYLNTSGKKSWKSTAEMINIVSRIIFPVSFFLFNGVFYFYV